MSVPLYNNKALLVPITHEKKGMSYRVAVEVIKPIAVITIMSNGIDFAIFSRWAILKMLIVSFF